MDPPGAAVALASPRTAKVRGSGTSRCAEAAIDKARALSSKPAAVTQNNSLGLFRGRTDGSCKERALNVCGA